MGDGGASAGQEEQPGADSPIEDDAGKPADSTEPSVKNKRKRKRRRRRRKKSSVKEKVDITVVLSNCKGYSSKQDSIKKDIIEKKALMSSCSMKHC